MSDDDYYFRVDLVAGIEPVLQQHQLAAMTFTWDGADLTKITFGHTPEATADSTHQREFLVAAAIKARIQKELAESYPENRGVAFRFELDLVKDLSELTWGLGD